MFKLVVLIVLVAMSCYSASVVHRNPKVTGLFSIVQFDNDNCVSTSSTTSNRGMTRAAFRTGICLTSQECGERQGTASGDCASGFGVCCIFLVSTSGASVSQNCTYLRNPGFPNSYSDTSNVVYTINRAQSDVCSLRLDFDDFTILGTTDTLETDGGTCADTFSVTSTNGVAVPVICGQNTGQHMYVDIGSLSSDTATLTFSFNGVSNNRRWEIKTSQIPCGRSNGITPPTGCLQYLTGSSGRFTTFNFLDAAGTHLANQEYGVCIRQERGFCCIEYSVCNDNTDSFALEGNMGTTTAKQDSLCTLDFIRIEASGGTCQRGVPLQTIERYCGIFLAAGKTAKSNNPICDCTAPFQVDVFTDNLDDAGNPGTGANNLVARGICLDYRQVEC